MIQLDHDGTVIIMRHFQFTGRLRYLHISHRIICSDIADLAFRRYSAAASGLALFNYQFVICHKYGSFFHAYTNGQAQQRMATLIAQLKTAEGITEALKATDPIAWAQRMNNIITRAEELVGGELIYT